MTTEREAPVHVRDGVVVYSNPGESVYVHEGEVYIENFLYPDGVSLTELRGLILKVDMAHDEHTGKGTITPGNLVLDAFKAMALGLADLQRFVKWQADTADGERLEGRPDPVRLTRLIEAGASYRIVLDHMRSLFQREG